MLILVVATLVITADFKNSELLPVLFSDAQCVFWNHQYLSFAIEDSVPMEINVGKSFLFL